MMQNAIHIRIGGRDFSSIEGYKTHSAGSYISYGGLFYPVREKSGYPLSILGSIAAGMKNKVVVISTDVSVIIFISRSTRPIQEFQIDSLDLGVKESIQKSVKRMVLLSDHPDVVLIGNEIDLGDTPFTQVAISKLNLPIVIRRKKTFQMLGAFVACVVIGFGINQTIKSSILKTQKEKSAEFSAIQNEMLTLMKDIKGLKQKIKDDPATSLVQPNLDMPTPSKSFASQIKALKNVGSYNVKVVDGLIQYQ